MKLIRNGFSSIPLLIIIVLITTLYLGYSSYKKGQLDVPFLAPYGYNPEEIKKTLDLESLNWYRYNDENYSFKIPPTYKYYENQTISADGSVVQLQGTNIIISPEIPLLKTNFSIKITGGVNKYGEVSRVVDMVSQCMSVRSGIPIKTTIDDYEALLYKDTPCGIAGGSFIYVSSSKYYFEFKVESGKKYYLIEPYVSEILSTFEFKN